METIKPIKIEINISYMYELEEVIEKINDLRRKHPDETLDLLVRVKG